MLPSECPYPETNPNHPASHPLGSSAQVGDCAQCRRYFRRCSGCQAANRWLARFCRNCGQGLHARDWLPDTSSEDSPQPSRWPAGWNQIGELGFAPIWAGLLDGQLFALGRSGGLRLWNRHSDEFEDPCGPLGTQLSPPSYLHGYLAVPNQDSITLVDLLDARGSGPRRVQRLRGPLLCPTASDRAHWLAALVQDGESRSLQLFRLHQGKLQLSWNQVVAGGAPGSGVIPRIAWCDQVLIYFHEEGRIQGIEPTTGAQRFEERCPCPPASIPPWSSPGELFWAGQDGSLWWLRMSPEVQLHQLSGAQNSQVYALASQGDTLLVSYGRKLMRLQVSTGRNEVLDLPQYCTIAPWIQGETALVHSQEGQLYRIPLGQQNLQVESSERMPASFSNSLIGPIGSDWGWYTLDSDGRLFRA